MKLHLPYSLFRALLACFASAAVLTGTSFAERVDSITYTTHQDGPLEISENAVVSFEKIRYAGNGAAIYQGGENSTVLTSNDSILFNGNASFDDEHGSYNYGGRYNYDGDFDDDGYFDYGCAYGGAISNAGGVCSLNGNRNITFSENRAIGYNDLKYYNDGVGYGYGGAISNVGGTFLMSENEVVTFSRNESVGDTAFFGYGSNYGHFIPGSDGGGAIYNENGIFSLSGNGDVSFSENEAYVNYGGAINNRGVFELCDNRNITFSRNVSERLDGKGGAIYNEGSFLFRGNENVSFDGNEAPFGAGGAIYNKGFFSLKENRNIIFKVDNSSTADSTRDGTAIYSNGTFNLCDNGNVSFIARLDGNSAICNDGDFTLSGNADVSFRMDGDYMSSYMGYTIQNGGTFTLSGNEDVSFFVNNMMLDEWELPYCGAIENSGTFILSGNKNVSFSKYSVSGDGTMINNMGSIFYLNDNWDVTFSGNRGSYWGGAINNVFRSASFTMSGNKYVTFNENLSSYAGGAISNIECGSFLLNHNGKVSFIGNSADFGGAIYNADGGSYSLVGNEEVSFNRNSGKGSAIYNASSSPSQGVVGLPSTFTLSGNGEVSFNGNIGCAIYNEDTFLLSNNGEVSFVGNSANLDRGGAIYNYRTSSSFTLSGNGNVLFEKNYERVYRYGRVYTYSLRSIYSEGTLNLSATEGKHITFRDSVYASGTVNLNSEGAGDIIFTGVSTEADLREVKGGVDGTAEEILNSRTSEIATNATLYGGRLIVEDGAILKGQGITVTEGANATIRLNGGTLDETGYAIAVSPGSGLELEGGNVLKSASVQMADGAFLSFVMGEGSGTNWDAQLTTGQLHVQVSGDLFSEHRLMTLADISQYDTKLWTSDAISVSGVSFDSLSWNAGVLTYTPHVITPAEDGALDELLPDAGDAIIDGGGHSLTVKNEVQLVQMALKDGIVKLEGENNNIVSVTLTEGGELVLAAGAGLTTGDIISMVASGKGELVISGDITIDSKGMKGKAGAQASVSHADAQVLGDATISNVRVEDSVIDLAECSTVTFSHVALAAGARITDDPATLALEDVTAELKLGVNTAVVSVDEVLHAGSTLVQNGNENVSLTLAQDAVVVQLEVTTFDSVTLTGDSLVLQLSGAETEFFNGADYIAVSFTSGTGLATFGTDLEVLLTLDEEHYVHGFYVQGSDHTAMLFATNDNAVVTPEPATATLSLLALASLAARRKRK